MDMDKLNKWLTLSANFGVLAGIIFLAVELRQNESTMDEANRINVLNARAIELETSNSFRALIVQDEELARIWLEGLAGAALEPLDMARFETLCTTRLWNKAVQFERSLVLGEILAQGSVRLRARNLEDNPGLRRCWSNNTEAMRTLGFGPFVDAVEAETGSDEDRQP